MDIREYGVRPNAWREDGTVVEWMIGEGCDVETSANTIEEYLDECVAAETIEAWGRDDTASLIGIPTGAHPEPYWIEYGDARSVRAIDVIEGPATEDMVEATVGTWVEIVERSQWHVYGTLGVVVDDLPIHVSVAVGVPESDRGTAEASGSTDGLTTAWWTDSGDWDGLTEGEAAAVLREIDTEAEYLWASADRMPRR